MAGISTKDYNNLLALAQLGGDLSDSDVPSSPERDAMWAEIQEGRASGKTFWPIHD